MTFLEGGGIMKTIRFFFIPSAGRGLRLARLGIKRLCSLSITAQSLIIQVNGSVLVFPEYWCTGNRMIAPVRLMSPGCCQGGNSRRLACGNLIDTFFGMSSNVVNPVLEVN